MRWMNRLQDVRLLKFKTKGENDMKKMIQKVPIPLCGVMLGFAALGNLLQSYGEGIRYVCGGIATFLLILQMPKVFASYFIVYVGIAVAAVTAPAFEELAIGAGAFWFGFLTLIGLLVLVTIRYMKYKEIPEPAKPLFCIYAAPTSLCVAGYVQSVTPKSREFLLAMLLVATVLYVLALVKAISYLKLKFYPSYAAFTFPFVISAIATKQTMVCLANMKQPIPMLRYVVLIETVIAVLFMIYIFIRFLQFIFVDHK